MKAIRKAAEIPSEKYANCHDGTGLLECYSLLDGLETKKFPFMHRDFMAAGVSIGDHLHTINEEIYYLISGKGILTFDGVAYDMEPGDISVCPIGHTHGFLATEDAILIVVSSELENQEASV